MVFGIPWLDALIGFVMAHPVVVLGGFFGTWFLSVWVLAVTGARQDLYDMTGGTSPRLRGKIIRVLVYMLVWAVLYFILMVVWFRLDAFGARVLVEQLWERLLNEIR
jgi:hypothetical protein